MATLRPSAANNGSLSWARRFFRPLGFANGSRSGLFLVFGGLMMLFCVERLNWYLNNAVCSRPDLDIPGECYRYHHGFHGAAYRLHIVTVIPGSFLACLQFIPALQRGKFVLFHRISGYLVLVLSILGAVTAGIIGNVAVGGTLLMQVGQFVAVGSFGFALAMAYISIRRLEIDQHREWMLRAWSYAGMIITMRPMLITMALAISGPESPYYQPMACKIIDFILHGSHEGMDNGPHEKMMDLTPGCAAYVTGENPAQFTAVRANWADDNIVETAAAIQIAFTMSGYLSFLIHAAAAELYINKTSGESERLRVVSKHRRMVREQGRPRAYSSGQSTMKQPDILNLTSGSHQEK